MIKNLLKKSWMPLFISSCIFVYFQLQIYNLGIQFRDEGFLLLNATRIISGEIPYKDFFLTTTPGSFYLAAFYTNFFGPSLIYGRILYFAFVIGILVLVNLIYRINIVHKYVLLISLSLLFLGIGSYAYYNIEALTFGLAAFYFLLKGLETKNRWLLFLSGVLIGISFIFKQSFAFWPGFSFLLLILLDKQRSHKTFEYILSYVLGGLTIVIPFFLYFYFNGALSESLYYISTFSREVKAHRTPFIIKSIISIPLIFIGIKIMRMKTTIKFIKRRIVSIFIIAGVIIGISIGSITSYFDLSRIYYALFIIFPIAVVALVKRTNETKLLIYSAIFLLALFISNASSGRELGVVMWVSSLFLPLIILVGEQIASKRQNKNYIYAICYFLILVQALYLSSNSLNPSGRANGLYVKEELKYELDSRITTGIKVSSSTKSELDKLIVDLKNETAGKKLLCFPYCPLMSPLLQVESPSYYNFFYPEAFLPRNQDEVIKNLKSTDAIVVLQKKGKIEPEALYEDVRFGKLKNYVVDNYKKIFETNNFSVYSPR